MEGGLPRRSVVDPHEVYAQVGVVCPFAVLADPASPPPTLSVDLPPYPPVKKRPENLITVLVTVANPSPSPLIVKPNGLIPCIHKW